MRLRTVGGLVLLGQPQQATGSATHCGSRMGRRRARHHPEDRQRNIAGDFCGSRPHGSAGADEEILVELRGTTVANGACLSALKLVPPRSVKCWESHPIFPWAAGYVYSIVAAICWRQPAPATVKFAHGFLPSRSMIPSQKIGNSNICRRVRRR